jgi:hypothetical protein
MKGEEFDLEEELGGSFSIPTQSTSSALNKSNQEDENEIRHYIANLHSAMLKYEDAHVETRYKSYDLIRAKEQLDRYHSDAVKIEVTDGSTFVRDLLSELVSKKAAGNSDCFRALAQSYVNSYLDKKSSPHNFSFPWPTYDDDVAVSCRKLIVDGNVDKCRAYMLGYFECMCFVPRNDQSEQGRVFTNHMGWAAGRHPFRSLFSYIVIGIYASLKRVRLELISGARLCDKIIEIIEHIAGIWMFRRDHPIYLTELAD